MSATADIKSVVRARYGALAESAAPACCGPSACCGDGSLDMIGDAYAGLKGYVADADLGRRVGANQQFHLCFCATCWLSCAHSGCLATQARISSYSKTGCSGRHSSP